MLGTMLVIRDTHHDEMQSLLSKNFQSRCGQHSCASLAGLSEERAGQSVTGALLRFQGHYCHNKVHLSCLLLFSLFWDAKCFGIIFIFLFCVQKLNC